MQSTADDVETYLAGLEQGRREMITAVRDVVAEATPAGYVEQMAYGMIGWVVPLERYPDTYNGQPLSYVGLASQKNHGSLYLMCLYSEDGAEQRFRERWSGGAKLDMGKSCIRFRSVEALDLPLIAQTVASVGVDDFIALYERSRTR